MDGLTRPRMLLPLWLLAGVLSGVAILDGLFIVPAFREDPGEWWSTLSVWVLLPVFLLALLARRIRRVMRERNISSNSAAFLVCYALWFVGLTLGGLVLFAVAFR